MRYYPPTLEPPRHFHQFIIPVEWQSAVLDRITHKRVSKLRCECGEETER